MIAIAIFTNWLIVDDGLSASELERLIPWHYLSKKRFSFYHHHYILIDDGGKWLAFPFPRCSRTWTMSRSPLSLQFDMRTSRIFLNHNKKSLLNGHYYIQLVFFCSKPLAIFQVRGHLIIIGMANGKAWAWWRGELERGVVIKFLFERGARDRDDLYMYYSNYRNKGV